MNNYYYCKILIFIIFSFFLVPPSFIDNPTSVNLTAGSSVTVLCNVTGFPQPEVDILKDGVTDSSLSYERSNGSLPNGLLFQSVSLLLSDVTFADTALYSCSASNKLASQVTNMSPAALHTVQCKELLIVGLRIRLHVFSPFSRCS